MKNEQLQKKVNQAIKLLQSVAKSETVEVAYSGGKDSDVILQLVRESGIKYVARYKNTTIDPPGTIKHCKENGVEIINPKETFFELIRRKGFPSRYRRFCCEVLKEYPSEYKISVVGVRREESKKRANLYKEPVICRIYNKTKHIQQILPLLEWNKEDIKQFVQDRQIKLHPLYYDQSGNILVDNRLGCMGCPLISRRRRIEFFKENPKWLKAWIRAGEVFYKNKKFNVYEIMVGQLLYDNFTEFSEIQNGLFGKMDCKKLLEEKFNIKL